MPETTPQSDSGSTPIAADERLRTLLTIRAEKWDRIKHLDGLDGELLKVYVALMGAAGGFVVWFASRLPAAGANLGVQQMVGIGTVFLLLSIYCIASVIRNYVNYLRALAVVNALEAEAHRLGAQPLLPSLRFRPPTTLWAFLSKLSRTTRGPLIALYFSCTPAMAWAMAPVIPGLGSIAWVFLALLVPTTSLLAIVHWRSFDRVDSAGFVVLTRAAASGDQAATSGEQAATSGDLLVALLRSYDGKWGHPKGARKSKLGLLDSSTVTRWRELEEEVGLHVDGHAVTQRSTSPGETPSPLSKVGDWAKAEKTGRIFVSRYFLDTYADPEPETWRGAKAVRLWALYIPSICPPPQAGQPISTSQDENAGGQWKRVTEVLNETHVKHEELRAPYVRDALVAALAATSRRTARPG